VQLCPRLQRLAVQEHIQEWLRVGVLAVATQGLYLLVRDSALVQ
jgi:hypothetical protein